jgi:hypothetical protein
MRWLPLSKRQDPREAEAYGALHDGIPDWLKPSVGHWIDSVLVTLCETTGRDTMRALLAGREQKLESTVYSTSIDRAVGHVTDSCLARVPSSP